MIFKRVNLAGQETRGDPELASGSPKDLKMSDPRQEMQSSQNSIPPWKNKSRTVIFSVEDSFDV